MPAAVLTYGASVTQKISKLTRLPVINLEKKDWLRQAEDAAYPDSIEECKFQTVGIASAIARKKLPPTSIEQISSRGGLCSGEPEPSAERAKEVAAKVEEIVISPKYHPSVEEAKIWLTTHHLTLIEKFIADGYKIEILDELNNVVREIG